ncbi:MAG: redox-sensing transcriptional repressor Rex [Candidatus Omnitrophota bacterium]|nr:MAG: redox-sensing transcriptional repressor Rex [Candidatus Omnitrophota bacterium]
MERERICTKKSCFSFDTIKRLSLYLRNLKRLKEKGIEIISSDRIIPLLNVSSAQFRKDLSYFGEFGKRGVGYEVGRLIKELEEILGTNKEWKIALVGVGRLGQALLGFEGFSKFNIKIVCAFDIDKKKVGKVIEGVKVEDMKKLKTIIKRKRVKIALLCTPPHSAQEVSEKLVAAGIRGILNFSPLILKVPSSVFVSNVDMACELESLIFFLKRNERKV